MNPGDIGPHSHRLRIGRWSESGAFYFITTATEGRERLLQADAAARIVVHAIEWMEEKGRWEWLCYVVMPDHLHVLFELRGPRSLSAGIQGLKAQTGKEINRALGRVGAVWQDGFFDHRIRSEEKLEQVVFYCLRNPALAGLVKAGKSWPYWGCKADMWERVRCVYDDLLILEREEKMWRPVRERG